MRHFIYDAAAQVGVPQDAVDGAAKASPGLLVTIWTYLLGKDVNFWVSLAVLTFTVLQIIVLFRKEFLKRREGDK